MASQAAASDTRPLRIGVGFAPGGSLDTVARLMASEMAKGLGRPVIVENKPGANGNIAAEQVARGPADGSVMLATFNTHPLIGLLYPGVPFDPIADFRAVGLIAATPYLLVANPGVQGGTMREVIDLARAAGRPLSFATVGPGSPQHLSIERMKMSMQVPVTIVHYKGGAPAQQDVLAANVDMMLSTVALAMPHVRAGKLKVLAVSSAARLPALPDVATLMEAGIADFVSQGWFGFMLPAKSSGDVVSRYNAELNRALRMEPVRAALDQMGASPLGGTPEEMDALIREEQRIWTRIIVDGRIKPE
jgi:tripartite-type tricarboxylate transporter receptor subunit TctC